MKQLSKIVWSEGMYLAPHHFQAQNRYFEDSVQFAITSLWRDAYGLISCELNDDAIRNGTVALVHAVGVFPDGLPFDMPECDPLPPPRNIRDLFSPVAEDLTICLGVPRQVPGGPNCTLTPNGRVSTRYLGSAANLADDNSGQDEKAVTLGRKNIALVLTTEKRDDLLTLPIARVLRDGAGHFVYDTNFIAPSLKLSASGALIRLAQRLLEILEDKSTAVLSGSVGRQGRFQAGVSAGQVAQFWFLHALHSHLAPLRHLVLSKHAHPEELYRELLRLGGALCTFGLDSHPRTLPAYDHQNAEACFYAVDEHIRRHLEIVLPSKALSIPLTESQRYFYEGDLKDPRCFSASRWILGVQAKMGEADLITRVPQLVKFCSSRFVPELVRRAVPGLTLTHIPVPPSAIAARVESQYFAVSKSGPCWEHILQTKRVGVYVPGEFPRAELELTVILES
jgi:type VI secretion system protein ImpJ